MNFYSEEMLQKKAVRYMEKKFGDEGAFSVKMAYVEGEIYNIYMNVEGHEEWKPMVCWNYETKVFTDNYMSWVFQEQVEEAFYPLFNEIYGDCKIFNEPYGFQTSDRYNNKTTLEHYLSTVNASDFCLFSISDVAKKEDDLQKICDLIKIKQWEANITIMYISESDLIKINRLNYEEILDNENYSWRTDVIIRTGEENFIDSWDRGRIQ